MDLLHYLPLSFFKWCEATWPGSWIKSATWVFAITETIHIMVLAVLLGTIFVVDLRLLGLGLRRISTPRLARDLRPWTLTSTVLMVLTGVPLYMSEAVRLCQSVPFFYKMVFLALALITHFTFFQWATRKNATEGAAFGKLTACLSLIFWFGVALGGRAIAFL